MASPKPAPEGNRRVTNLRVFAHGTGALVMLIAASQVETPLALMLIVAAFASIGVVVVVGFIQPNRRNNI